MRDPAAADIFKIIEMFKNGNSKGVIDYIKNEGLDPSYSDEIISDYAAIHLNDDLIVDFFKDMHKLGGNPWGHDSIFKNSISNNKINGFKYLIEHENFQKISYTLLYVVNTACMKDKGSFLELLDGKIDLFDIKMDNENNPSFINVSLSYLSSHVLNYFLPKYGEKVFNCLTNSEAIGKLEGSLESKEKVLDFANMYIKKISKFAGIKDNIKISQIEALRETMAYLSYKALDHKISDVVKMPKTKKI